MFSVRHKKLLYFQTFAKESLLNKQIMYVSDNSVLYASGSCIIFVVVYSGMNRNFSTRYHIFSKVWWILFVHLFVSAEPICENTKEPSDSSETVVLFSPYFYNPSTDDVLRDCFSYITSPPSYQVQLSIIEADTVLEQILIQDDPSSTNSYRVVDLSGQLSSRATIISTRGGLTLWYNDYSPSYNGRGFVGEAKIHGMT